MPDRPTSKSPTPKRPLPDISIVIPVLNEGARLTAALARLDRQAGATWEAIAVDGDPAGATVAGLAGRRQTAGGQPLKTAIAPPGRASQMNAGARLAAGRILLFLHADTQLPPGALARIAAALPPPEARSPGEPVAGAFDLGIDSPRWTLRWLARLASWRSRLTRIPYGDQGTFVDRAYFETVLGGFPEIPLMEDVALMRAIARRGDRVTILPDRVLTSSRRWDREGVLYCTLRNWTLLALYYAGVDPARLVRFYYGSPTSGRSRRSREMQPKAEPRSLDS